jgi:hypothetical protein
MDTVYLKSEISIKDEEMAIDIPLDGFGNSVLFLYTGALMKGL